MLMSSFAALAEGGTTPPTNNLTPNTPLTITNLQGGDTVNLYKVIQWNENSGWDFTTQFASLGSMAVASVLADGETVEPRIDTVLKYITGVPATYTTDADGNVTTNNDAIPGQINSKLAGIIAGLAGGTAADTKTLETNETSYSKAAATGDAGLYVALIAAGQSGWVYNPVFIASNYINANGTPATDTNNVWNLTENASYSDSAFAKKEKITVDKKVADKENDQWVDGELTDLLNGGGYSYDAASTSKVGDVVDFDITTTIPVYASNYTVNNKALTFTVYDVMSTGLELYPNEGTSMGTVTVQSKVGEGNWETVDSSNYNLDTVATGNGTAKNVTVAFTSAYVAGRTVPTNIKISYKAKVTDAANYNVNRENNTVTVEYSNNPEDDSKVGVLKDVTNHYTFSLDAAALGVSSYETSELIKVGVDKDGNEITEKRTLENGSQVGALQGANFALFTDAACSAANQIATATSDQEGKLNFKGLDVGTYYLKETSAPAGYIMSDVIYRIEIKADFVERDVQETVSVASTSGKTVNEVVTYKTKILESYTVGVFDGDASTGTVSTYTVANESDSKIAGTDYYAPTGIVAKNTSTHKTGDPTYNDNADHTHKLLNTQGTALPSTGGMGTTILYVGGSILVILAAILLITKRRMNAND